MTTAPYDYFVKQWNFCETFFFFYHACNFLQRFSTQFFSLSFSHFLKNNFFILSLPAQDTRETFDENFDAKCQTSAFSIPESRSSSIQPEIEFQHSEPCGQMPADLALFNEFNTGGGSLFSIHSAPLVQSGDLGGSTNGTGHNNTISPNDCNERRPISLALDPQQTLSTKSVFLELSANNKRTGDIDEEDTDNLLTVSSVTARPLIAKSRELRSSK